VLNSIHQTTVSQRRAIAFAEAIQEILVMLPSVAVIVYTVIEIMLADRLPPVRSAPAIPWKQVIVHFPHVLAPVVVPREATFTLTRTQLVQAIVSGGRVHAFIMAAQVGAPAEYCTAERLETGITDYGLPADEPRLP